MPQDNMLTRSSPFMPVPPAGPTRQAIEQFLYVVFKYRWLIAGVVAAFLIAATAAALRTTSMRMAEAKVLVKPDRVSLQIANLSPQSAKVPYSPQRLQSEIELIRSRDVLTPVAEKLLRNPEIAPDQRPMTASQMIRRIKEHIQAVPNPGTSVIEVQYFAPTVQEAETTLEWVLKSYLKHRAAAYSGSSELKAFYEQRQQQATKEVRDAEMQLAQWQDENAIISVDAQIESMLGLLGEQQAALQRTKADAAAAATNNQLLNRLEGDLLIAEVELHDLRQRYTDRDRRVQEKLAQVSMIRDQLREAKSRVLGDFAAKSSVLAKQVEQTKSGLLDLRKQKAEQEHILRRVVQGRERLQLYGERLQEAQVAAQLDEQQLSEISIIERPHETDYTNDRQRSGLVVASSMTGLVFGLAAAFGLALFNKSIRTRHDVENYLGLPVLATVPELEFLALPAPEDDRGHSS